MLLDSFPYEIVEEIFLYLPPSDRINTVKVNRWLNSIGRSKRLAVRHTLDGTIASMWLTLKTNTFFIERTNVEGDHPPRDIHTVKLHYSRYAPTMQRPEDEENYDIKNITIFFETRCCPTHYEADTGLDSELWKFPAKFIAKYFYTSNHNDVYHFKFSTLGLMSEAINIYLHYFSNIFSSIDFFELVIHDSMMIWELLGLFFENYETLLKKPVIYFYNVAFNFSKFYWSKLFERGIESVGYQNVKEIFEFNEDYDKTSKFYEALSYNIMSETIAQLNDERLLLFKNYHKLEINCSSEITTNGLAKLVQKIYKNRQKCLVNVRIRFNMRRCELATGSLEKLYVETLYETLSLIPKSSWKCQYDDITFQHVWDKVSMINAFDQKYHLFTAEGNFILKSQ